MPNVTIEALKIDIEAKRILVQEITDAVAKAYGSPKEHIVILVKQFDSEDFSIGGSLISDRRASS